MKEDYETDDLFIGLLGTDGSLFEKLNVKLEIKHTHDVWLHVAKSRAVHSVY